MFSEARSKGSAAQLQVEPFGLCLTYVGQPANKPEHLHAIVDFLLVVRHIHSLSLVSEGGLCQYDWVSEDRVERSLRIVPDCAGLCTVRGQRSSLWFPTLSYSLPPLGSKKYRCEVEWATFSFRRFGIMNRKLASSAAVNPPSVFLVSHFCSTVAGSSQGCNHAPIVALSLCLSLPSHGTLSLTCLLTTS